MEIGSSRTTHNTFLYVMILPLNITPIFVLEHELSGAHCGENDHVIAANTALHLKMRTFSEVKYNVEANLYGLLQAKFCPSRWNLIAKIE